MHSPQPGFLHEPIRETPIWGEYDVVVLGGGPAGIAAAASAARGGCTTLLIERYGFLGGMGTAAGVTNFCGLHANVHGTLRQVVHGVADDLLARMDGLGGLSEPHVMFGGKIAAQAYDNAALKVAADGLVLDSGAQLLFHATLVGVQMDGPRTVRAAFIETRSGRHAVLARTFIDCSGDGDLAALAGAPFEKGTSGQDMMYPSTMFRINGVDAAAAGDAYNHFGRLMEEAEKRGRRFPRKTPIIRPQKNPTEWRANVTQLANADGGPVDGTDAAQLSDAEVQGRRQIVDFFQFLREAAPGFQNAYILEIAPQVGIRETRRVIGDYQLTEHDVLQCASFEDSIGVNGWMIEEHVAGNIAFRWQDIPGSRGFNHLPYRMLLSRGMDNLLVAGRCASMTHLGQSAARVSGGCFVMGQAAGTAAALAAKVKLPPRDLPVQTLQRQLEADGAYLGRDVA
ncbi:FAD-dependent oxidoreductase [Hydrogenophaga sp. OTU3427]|uniref:FAD-dependent oxidoreductase n=1 Tax=Hydrogenophaga sp. OTU3427 TaxID=3043856 RepID=UPI00313C45FC